MPRKAREKSESGIYHIILRGINRQIIFEDDEDRIKFLDTIKSYKEKSGYKIYGYCLMDNHVHLLLKEEKEDLGIVMRRIGASFVYWYNWKYDRSGHLFQDRYKSETVETDNYYITVMRYIHQNPIKAGIVEEMSIYQWSSYREFMDKRGITDVEEALNLIDENREKALKEFEEYHREINNDNCLEIEEIKKLRDSEAIELIKKICGVEKTTEIMNFEKEQRDSCLKRLKDEKLSTRQIERLTGVSRQIVLKS
jgi:putative transposase